MKSSRAGEALPLPTEADGFTPAELARHAEDLRVLAADPRTAGPANRPARLVRRVLETPAPAPKKLGGMALVLVLEDLESRAGRALARFEASEGRDERARAEADRLAAAIQALVEEAIS